MTIMPNLNCLTLRACWDSLIGTSTAPSSFEQPTLTLDLVAPMIACPRAAHCTGHILCSERALEIVVAMLAES